MTKNKNLLLVIALVTVLAMSMFMLTGCGNDASKNTASKPANTAAKPANTTSKPANNAAPQSSDESSEESTDTTSSNNVIQVPMAVVNQCPNTTITALYLSGAGLDSWGDDLLAGRQMPTGTQLSLTFNIDKNNIKWDVKAVDETGTAVEFRNLDLSNVSTSGGTITLAIDENGQPVAVAQ